MRLTFIISFFFLTLFAKSQGTFYMLEHTDTVGASISVPICVTGFDNIISFQGSILFDPTILSFINVSACNISGLSISSFGLTQSGLGIITYSWFDPSLQGESLSDSSILCSLDFTVDGMLGQGCSVYFSSNPTSQEVVDSNLVVKTFFYTGMFFLIDNFLSQNDNNCINSVFPSIVLENNFVKINNCENLNSLMIFSLNGILQTNNYFLNGNKLFFFKKGVYFIKRKKSINKVFVI